MHRRSVSWAATFALVAALGAAGCGPSETGSPAKSVPVETLPKDPLAASPSPAEEAQKQPSPPATPKAEPSKDPTKIGSAASEKAAPPPGASTKNPDGKRPSEMVKPGAWGPSDLDARTLAQRVDRAVRGAQNVGGETWLNAEIRENAQQREASRGYANAQVRILDGRRFDVEYTLLGPEKMMSARLVSDGAKRSRFLTGRGWDPLPTAEPALALQGPALVQAWPRQFPMLIYAPLATSANTWERLAAALGRGEGGYRLQTQRIVNEVQGRPRPQYRLVAERTPEAAKRLGPSRLEMRIDGVRFLPVTVLVDHRPLQGAHYNLNWTSSFRIGERFAPETFKVPKGPMRPEVTAEPGA